MLCNSDIYTFYSELDIVTVIKIERFGVAGTPL
jgi:hypothetical protein